MTIEDETIEAARVYANSIAPHSLNEKYCEIDFIAGAMWRQAHPYWISVEDELPPKKNEYDDLSINVLATDGKEIYESVYYHESKDWFTHDMWGLDNITHWMHKPQAPKKGD